MADKEFAINLFTKMKCFQEIFLEYIDNDDTQDSFSKICNYIDDQKIKENQDILKEILYFISKIINNYRHSANFFSKIENVLCLFETEMRTFYSELELFNIFKKTNVLFFICLCINF